MFTDIRVVLVSKDNLRAIASCRVANCIYLTGIRVVEGRDGKLFIAMPARKNKRGEYQDIFFPINKEIREELSKLIINKYHEVTPTITMQEP